MRFFHQDEGAKVSTKCIRVSSTATTRDVLNTLIEKFRPDMRMLSLPEYSLYEVHVNGGRVFCLYHLEVVDSVLTLESFSLLINCTHSPEKVVTFHTEQHVVGTAKIYTCGSK